jgi:hypothetical protein
LRKTKEECLDLPSLTRSYARIGVCAEQQRAYDEIVCEMKAVAGRGKGRKGGGAVTGPAAAAGLEVRLILHGRIVFAFKAIVVLILLCDF